MASTIMWAAYGFAVRVTNPHAGCDPERSPNSPNRETGPVGGLAQAEEDLRKPAWRAPYCCEVFEGDAGAAACGVATATRTVSPAAKVSGGLLIIRSDRDRPAITSTLSPKSRPSWTFLRATLSLLSSVATCVP